MNRSGFVDRRAAVFRCVAAIALWFWPGIAGADTSVNPGADLLGSTSTRTDGISNHEGALAIWGPVAGALTALIPLAVGGTLLARDSRPDLQRDGAYVILSGFAAAPLVSHAITGRWSRGLVFGLGSVSTAAGALVAMQVQNPFDPIVANRERLAFGFLLTSAFFAATIGVIDSFIVGPAPRGPQ